MTLLDELKKLFVPEPDVKPDESYPDESKPGYWEAKDATGFVYEPPVPNGGWAPTDDLQQPGYRGVQDHGVPYDAAVNYIVPNMDALNAPQDGDEDESDTVEYETQTPLEPIPVNVVSLPEPVGVEKRIATNQFLIAKGAAAVQIAPQSHARTTLWITVTGNDVIYIARDPQAATVSGFQVHAGLGNFTIDTTDPIYAFVPAAAANDVPVYTMENFDVTVNQHVE